MNPDQLPPNSPEAERGVLACLLSEASSECLDDALAGLTREGLEFYDLRHRTIWEAITSLRTDGHKAVDTVLLYQRLKDREQLEAVGGPAFVSTLPEAGVTFQMEAYLALLRDKWTLRRWGKICGEIQSRVLENPADVEGFVNDVSGQLFRLTDTRVRSPDQTIAEVLADVQEEYLDKFQRGVKRHVGPQTGFNYLDNIVPGFAPGDLVVLAARPRTGKSAIILQWAEFMAGVAKAPVGIISLEMTSRALGARALFQKGGEDMTKFLNGFASAEYLQKLSNAMVQLSKLPIVFNQSPDLSIEELEVRARRMVHRHNLAVLMIDYFQLLYSTNKQRNWNTNDELGYISRRLKGLARALHIPILLCAQMNREIEKESHRRPRLSDLRDTGQLEQDADIVIFLWKPQLQKEAGSEELKPKWQQKIDDILPRVPCPEEWKGKHWKDNLAYVTATVEKQREGRSGEDAALIFIKPWTRFVDAYNPLGGRSDQPELDRPPPVRDDPLPTDEEIGRKRKSPEPAETED